ncbi:hypothetical protein LJC43_04610 [Parabacteroides sp. OttesenSCG-928-G21]|nr:hypothetical protein [Parabacteroides sp. OttesenSCG-928-G21]
MVIFIIIVIVVIVFFIFNKVTVTYVPPPPPSPPRTHTFYSATLLAPWADPEKDCEKSITTMTITPQSIRFNGYVNDSFLIKHKEPGKNNNGSAYICIDEKNGAVAVVSITYYPYEAMIFYRDTSTGYKFNTF